MAQIYDTVKNTIYEDNIDEASKIIFCNSDIKSYTDEYYQSIITGMMKKKESLIQKVQDNLIVEINSNNINDIYNIVFIAEYIKEKDLLKIEYEKYKTRCVSELKRLYDEYMTIIQEHQGVGADHADITRRTQQKQNEIFDFFRSEFNETPGMRVNYRLLEEQLNTLIDRKYKGFIDTFSNTDWVSIINSGNPVNGIEVIENVKQAFTIFHKFRNSFGHDYQDNIIGDIIIIDNDSMRVSIPIEYINGFNKGRIKAKKEDEKIIERTNSIMLPIIEYFNYDLSKLQSFFFNVNPSHLENLLSLFDNDMRKLYSLPSFLFKDNQEIFDSLKMFIQNGFNMERISMIPKYAYRYPRETIQLFQMADQKEVNIEMLMDPTKLYYIYNYTNNDNTFISSNKRGDEKKKIESSDIVEYIKFCREQGISENIIENNFLLAKHVNEFKTVVNDLKNKNLTYEMLNYYTVYNPEIRERIIKNVDRLEGAPFEFIHSNEKITNGNQLDILDNVCLISDSMELLINELKKRNLSTEIIAFITDRCYKIRSIDYIVEVAQQMKDNKIDANFFFPLSINETIEDVKSSIEDINSLRNIGLDEKNIYYVIYMSNIQNKSGKKNVVRLIKENNYYRSFVFEYLDNNYDGEYYSIFDKVLEVLNYLDINSIDENFIKTIPVEISSNPPIMMNYIEIDKLSNSSPSLKEKLRKNDYTEESVETYKVCKRLGLDEDVFVNIIHNHDNIVQRIRKFEGVYRTITKNNPNKDIEDILNLVEQYIDYSPERIEFIYNNFNNIDEKNLILENYYNISQSYYKTEDDKYTLEDLKMISRKMSDLNLTDKTIKKLFLGIESAEKNTIIMFLDFLKEKNIDLNKINAKMNNLFRYPKETIHALTVFLDNSINIELISYIDPKILDSQLEKLLMISKYIDLSEKVKLPYKMLLLKETKVENIEYILKKSSGDPDKILNYPLEFFTCDISQIDEMFKRYNSNIAKSLFGVDNPKLIATIVYCNNVLRKYNKKAGINDQIDIDVNNFIMSGLSNTKEYLNMSTGTFMNQFHNQGNNDELKGFILDKLRNSFAHIRFNPIKDSNGNIIDNKLHLYDQADENEPHNFDIVVDTRELIELVRTVELVINPDENKNKKEQIDEWLYSAHYENGLEDNSNKSL